LSAPSLARLVLAASAAALVAACSTSAADGEAAPASAIVGQTAPAPDVTIPSGTVLRLTLTTPVASDTSAVEDAVAAELTNALMVGGRTALPAGALLTGFVRAIDPAGRVKEPARVALDFTSVTSGGRRYALSAEHFSRQASSVSDEDPAKIAATKGEEVRFPSGMDVSIRLAAPLTVGVGK
jgi:hypothetical protein